MAEERVRPTLRLQKACAEARKRLEQLQSETDALKSLQWATSPVHVFGVVAQSASQSNGVVAISNLTARSEKESVSPQVKVMPASAGIANRSENAKDHQKVSSTFLTIQGTAEDDVTLAAFLKQLRSNADFEQVDLKSATNTERNGKTRREFRIEGVLVTGEQ